MTAIDAGPEALLTVDEVAALLRVHPQNVRAMAKASDCLLREVKVGRYVRIPRSSYDAYIASLETT